MSDALFDGYEPPPPAPEPMSADRRRTQRQSDAIRVGQHPLSLATGHPLGLHPDADHDPEQHDGGPRCGDCRFRVLVAWHNRTYPKCAQESPTDYLDSPRATHGTATDVRAWWPACTDWEATP